MIEPKLKQARMKLKVRFARDRSTTLPRVDPRLSRSHRHIRIKRRDKTAIEFGESLMIYLGKKGDRAVLEIGILLL